MPLPSTRVFHPDWNTHHAPVAEGGMTATCEIRDPSDFTETFDRTIGQTTAIPAPPVYTGPCRVQSRSQQATRADAVGEDTTLPPYLVEILFAAPAVDEGWRVKVTACSDDLQLVGRTFTVRQVEYGTHRFSRVLSCDDE